MEGVHATGTGTSTIAGTLAVNLLNITGSGTSTFTNGIQLSGGCFRDPAGNCVGGGSGTPGGADTQVQFNDAGSFGGDAGLVYNKTTDVLTVSSVVMNSTTATSSVGTGGLAVGTTTPHSSSLFTIGTTSPLFVVDRISGKVGIGCQNNTPARWSFGCGSNPNVNPNVNLLVQDPSDARLGAAVGDKGIFLKAGTTGGLFAYDYAGGAALNLQLGEFGANVGVATVTPARRFSVQGAGLFSGDLSVANVMATGSATTTGNIEANLLNIVGSSGTSTIANNLNVSGQASFGGALSLAGAFNVLGKSTLAQATSSYLSVTNVLNVAGSGTSTFAGTLSPNLINVTGSGTSTFTNGVNLSTGCFAIRGTCVGGGAGTPGGASGNVQFNNGGSFGGENELFWDASNNRLGIGTTGPTSVFEVNQSDTNTTLTVGNNPAIRIVNRDTTVNNMSELSFTTNDTAGTALRSSAILGVHTSHTVDAMSGDLAFATRNAGTLAEKARITATGRLGIGTTSPREMLNLSASSGYVTAAVDSGATGGIFYAYDAGGIVSVGSRTASVFNLLYNNEIRAKLYGPHNKGTIMEVNAPAYPNNEEATLTLSLGGNGGQSRFADITREDYSGLDNFLSINTAANYRGGTAPILLRSWENYNNPNTPIHEYGVNLAFFDPSGVTAIGTFASSSPGISTSYNSTGPVLQLGASTTNPTQLAVYTGPPSASTQAFTVMQNGRVGVGTATPLSTFSVQGNGLISGGLMIASTTATGTITADGLTAVSTAQIPRGTNPTVTNGGQIGIDTTSGQFKVNTGNEIIAFKGTTTKAVASMASTTLASPTYGGFGAAATATVKLGALFPEAVTITEVYYTSDHLSSTAQNAICRVGDGTNYTNSGFTNELGQAVYVTSNGSFTANEHVWVQCGSATSTVPDSIQLSFRYKITAD